MFVIIKITRNVELSLIGHPVLRVGSVLHGQSSRSFTNERGAALILRYEALREDTLYGNFFKKHMLKYYRQWYNFALTECYRDIRICDLILVTGCDLTPQWATAIYVRNNQEINAASRAQVRSVAEVKFSLSAASRTLYSNTRRGPSQALHQQDRDETQNDRKTLVNNQCIFIRGIYIKDRFEEDGDGVVGDEYVTVESFPPKTRVSPLTIGYLSEGNFRSRTRPSSRFSSITCWR